MEEELPTGTDEEIANMELARADRFLDSIRDDPFVAVVLSNGRVRIYARADITPEHLRALKEGLRELNDGY